MNVIDNDTASKIKKDINAVIGRQIMLLRKSQGLSGQLLAKKLGVSQQQISRYERGHCKIDIDNLILFLINMDISLDIFFQRVFNDLRDNEPYSYELCCSVFKYELMADDYQSYYLVKANSNTIRFG